MSDDDSPAKPGRFPLPASAVATSRVRFFERSDWLSFCLTTGLTLAVYMVTLTPHITLGGSGMFSVGAMYAGVPHPPGYPLWTLYGWLFIKLLPVSGIAWRLAVASAVAGALASGVIALMVSRLGIQIAASLPSLSVLTRKESNLLRVGSGCVAGTVFGFNGGFWNTAVQVHVWPLSILLLCCVICLLLRWSYEPERKRYLYSACLLYGLTLTNSQIMLAVAPALPFLLLAGSLHVARDGFLTGSLLWLAGLVAKATGFFPMIESGGDSSHPLLRLYLIIGVVTSAMAIGLSVRTRRLFTEWKAMLVCVLLCLLGLLLYLYVPLASMTNPPANWGYGRTVAGFFHVISRGQYERLYPTDTLARYGRQLQMYGGIAGKEFGGAPLILAVIPLFFLHRMQPRERAWVFGLLALFVCLSFLMVAVLNPTDSRDSREIHRLFYSASYVVLSLCLGWGLMLLGVLFTKPSVPPVAVSNS